MVLSIQLLQILTAVALSAAVCGFAFYKKWLNAGGACSATVMGAIIWLAGGWNTTIPMLFFFVSGSVFSKINTNKKCAKEAKQSKPRDYIQVLCNGGIAAICLVFWMICHHNFWLMAYCTSLSISTADTWSSELGVRFGGKVVDIIGFKPLPAGISGGISAAGTLAGFAGSLLIGLLCWFLFQFNFFELVIITTGGFIGMLFDSFLGSRLQAKYLLTDGSLCESKLNNGAVHLQKGLAWMTNDMVNILANLLITAVTISLFFYYNKP